MPKFCILVALVEAAEIRSALLQSLAVWEGCKANELLEATHARLEQFGAEPDRSGAEALVAADLERFGLTTKNA